MSSKCSESLQEIQKQVSAELNDKFKGVPAIQLNKLIKYTSTVAYTGRQRVLLNRKLKESTKTSATATATTEQLFASGSPVLGTTAQTIEIKDSNFTDGYKAVTLRDNVSITQEQDAFLQFTLSTLVKAGLTNIGKVMVNLVDTTTKKNSGESMGATIKVGRTNRKLPPLAQSQREIYVHELVHSVFPEGLFKGSTEAKELANLMSLVRAAYDKDGKGYEIFLDRDNNGNLVITKEAVKEAKAYWNYIFNNPKEYNGIPVGMLEFTAYGLSNFRFAQAIKAVEVTEEGLSELQQLTGVKTKTGLGKLVNIVYSTLKKLLGLITKNPPTKGDDVYERLFSIMHSLNQMEASRQKETTDLNKVEELLERGNEKAAKVLSKLDVVGKVIDTAHKTVVKNSKKASSATSNFTQLSGSQLAVYRAATYKMARANGISPGSASVLASKVTTRKEFLDNAKLFSATLIKGNGLLAHFLKAFRANDPLIQPFLDRLRIVKAERDVQKMHLEQSITDMLKNAFTEDLTTADEESMTRIGLATDLVALREKFSDKDILELIKDETKLKQAILKQEQLVKNLVSDKTQQNFILNQSDNLGYFMVTGDTVLKEMPLRNVLQIAELNTFPATPSYEVKAVKDILEVLVSLQALSKTNKQHRQIFADLWTKQPNGIDTFLVTHAGFKEQALREMFVNNERLVIKGYYRNAYTANSEFLFDKPSSKADLLLLGYRATDKLIVDHVTGQELQLYVRGLEAGDMYTSGVFSMESLKARGHKVSDLLKNRSNLKTGEIRNEVQKEINGRYKSAMKEYQQRIPATNSNNTSNIRIMPLTSHTGEVVDMTIVMTEADKKEYLGKDFTATSLMGQMFSRNLSKGVTEELNSDTIKVAKDHWDNYGTAFPESFIRVHGGEFNADGTVNTTREQWDMLPKTARDEIKQVFGTSAIYVPLGGERLIFGGRKYSVRNSFLSAYFQKMFSDTPITYWLSRAETVWQEFVAAEKISIVIKKPGVFVLNNISNGVILMTEGLSPQKVAKYELEGAVALKNYERDEAKKKQLSAKLIGTQDPREKKRLEQEIINLNFLIENNPVNGMIKEGLFQMIAEDAENLSYGYVSGFERLVGSMVTDKVGSSSKQLGWIYDQAYMTEKSALYKIFNKGTQYSDFAARYAFIKHKQELNDKLPVNQQVSYQQIIREAVDTFVNYDVPDPTMLEYANAMGLVMFTKFFFGIQKVIARQIKNRAASTTTALALQYATLDVSDILESSVFMKDISQMFTINPLEHFDHIIEPSGLLFWYKLLQGELEGA